MTPMQMFVNFLRSHNLIGDENVMNIFRISDDDTDILTLFFDILCQSFVTKVSYVFTAILKFITDFITSMKDDFANIGQYTVDSFAQIKPLDSSIFMDNFFYFVIGFIVFAFVLKIAIDVITAVVSAIISLIP